MAKAKPASKAVSASDAALRELREYGLTLPGAHLKSPWPGHKDLAVNDKTFAYLPVEGDPFKISCKLPATSGVALMLPFCRPAAYGLGKSGWVAASPSPAEINVELFKQWIDESYRAQAPKKLVAQLGAAAPKPKPRTKLAAKPKAKVNAARRSAR